MVILEGMLNGLPIAATSVGGPADILKHEETALLFSPRNVQSLTSTLLRFVNDPPLRHRIGKAGARCVRRNSLWSNIVEKMRSVYQEIAPTSLPSRNTLIAAWR